MSGTIRNGEIDLLRFLFSLTIVMYHFAVNYSLLPYRNGGVGVEFFFFVTGALMVSKKYDSIKSDDIPKESYKFILAKLRSFYPYYLCALFLNLIVEDIILNHKTYIYLFDKILRGIPNLLLIQMSGILISDSLNVGGSWYLSEMMICLFILFPVYLKNRNHSLLLVFPIYGLMCFGMQAHLNSLDISSWTYWPVITRFLRGSGEIALGAWARKVSQYIQDLKLSKSKKLLLTILKYYCIVMALGYGIMRFSNANVSTIFCLFSIILCFSNSTYSLKGSPLTRYLGKLSLIVYITHFIMLTVCLNVLPKEMTNRTAAGCLITCVLFAAVFMFMVDKVILLAKHFSSH